MQSDGPENFIDPAPREEASTGSIANGWRDEHARKRSQTNLWRDRVSIGILIATALAGIGTIVVGVSTGTTQILMAGVAILSGTSGSAILALTRNRPPGDQNQEP